MPTGLELFSLVDVRLGDEWTGTGVKSIAVQLTVLCFLNKQSRAAAYNSVCRRGSICLIV